jgi:hypothetical protein
MTEHCNKMIEFIVAKVTEYYSKINEFTIAVKKWLT